VNECKCPHARPSRLGDKRETLKLLLGHVAGELRGLVCWNCSLVENGSCRQRPNSCRLSSFIIRYLSGDFHVSHVNGKARDFFGRSESARLLVRAFAARKKHSCRVCCTESRRSLAEQNGGTPMPTAFTPFVASLSAFVYQDFLTRRSCLSTGSPCSLQDRTCICYPRLRRVRKEN
jgi:hypothetical protein